MHDKKFLLFCFPFAGGTADFYNNLEKACGEEVRFIKLEYPGHGVRMKEPLCHSFDDLTRDLYPQIIRTLEEYPKMDYSMMGYSMGSIAMFDMLRLMLKNHIEKRPWSVFISAHQPQPVRALRNVPDEGIDHWVKERTIEFGGIDKRLLSNKSFWRVYLPIFKADYKMIADYEFEGSGFSTDIPATVFYSEEDTPYSEMIEWKNYFTGACDFIEYQGSHFFIDHYYQNMAMVILNSYKRGVPKD